MSNQHTEVQGT